VHRDLKPQNLFVTQRLNGAPLVKVLDFGIAKAVGAAAVGQLQLTDSQAVIGSPLYMAPEHMRSARAADTRSDVWSLGVILFELLGGQLPFDGETVTEVCIRVVNEAPPALAVLRPRLDPKLVEITMRCLEKDPARRWQTVAQLAGALEPFARSSMVGAVRPWRSLEDTANFPAGSPLAETSDASLVAGSSQPVSPAPSSSNAAARSDDGDRKLVSTDVAWGGASASKGLPEKVLPRSRFTVGMGVGALLAFAVAAIAVFALRSSSPASPPQPPTASAPPSAVEAVPVAPQIVPSATSEPTSAPLVASAPSTEARPRPPAIRSPRSPAVKPTAAPAPPIVPVEPESANGAPILR
jgi:serine/threonine-protein kinase